MRNRIAIVCNSKNPDLVEYFKCKIEALKQSNLKDDFIIFKNKEINICDKNIYNSSYTESSFFDKKVPIDFIKSFYLIFILLFNKVGVIHFTTAHISNIFLSILLKPFRIKQIFTIHDLVPHPGRKAIFINIYNEFVINILSDEIISFSKNEIKKQKNKEKFKYFTLSGFKQYVNEPKIGQKIILFFGRIEKYKGLDNLLDLIKKANKINLDYKFIIAGKGNIENINEFEEYRNVEIINRFINDDEVEKLFQKATFTILPYDSATQSGVTILSYAYATPIIAYDVGSLKEYIENNSNGFVVNYKDNNKIIDILRQIDKKAIKLLSNNIIREFKINFSEEACKLKYKRFYLEKMESKND